MVASRVTRYFILCGSVAAVIIIVYFVRMTWWHNSSQRPPDHVQIHLSRPFSLRDGQVATFPAGFSIRLVGIEDGRCPKGVGCIVEGQAVVSLEVKIGKSESIQKLGTNTSPSLVPQSLPMNVPSGANSRIHFTLTLKDVSPYPVYRKTQSSLKATLLLTENSLK